jgi:hypothetical protein
VGEATGYEWPFERERLVGEARGGWGLDGGGRQERHAAGGGSMATGDGLLEVGG